MKKLENNKVFLASLRLDILGFGFAIAFLSLALLTPVIGRVYAYDSATLLMRLERDDWQDFFARKGEKEKLDKGFDELVEFAWNKGIDYRIRLRGLMLLSKIRDGRRADVLTGMYHNPFFNAGCPDIKSSLMIALGNVEGDKKAVDTLLEGMNDMELQVREAAIRSLGKLGAQKAVPFLIDRLGDKSFAIRRSVIESLGLIRDQRAVPLLERIANEDKDDLIRREAKVSLTRMKS